MGYVGCASRAQALESKSYSLILLLSSAEDVQRSDILLAYAKDGTRVHVLQCMHELYCSIANKAQIATSCQEETRNNETKLLHERSQPVSCDSSVECDLNICYHKPSCMPVDHHSSASNCKIGAYGRKG